MAELTYQDERLSPWTPRPHWGAIWAGVFTFMAIWSVFGVLGLAIFSSAANPSNSAVSAGVGVGMGIWAVILSIIAMYVAGRVTGGLAGLDRSANAVIHGMVMFGLSVASVLVLMTLGKTSTVGAGASTPDLMHAYAGFGWAGFLSLLLGWLAAMGGAATGRARRITTESRAHDLHEVRPAA